MGPRKMAEKERGVLAREVTFGLLGDAGGADREGPNGAVFDVFLELLAEEVAEQLAGRQGNLEWLVLTATGSSRFRRKRGPKGQKRREYAIHRQGLRSTRGRIPCGLDMHSPGQLFSPALHRPIETAPLQGRRASSAPGLAGSVAGKALCRSQA